MYLKLYYSFMMYHSQLGNTRKITTAIVYVKDKVFQCVTKSLTCVFGQ
jgi:hypothetical protein